MSDQPLSPLRPLKLAVAALGGQGGGVLAEWLIGVAEAEGYLVQSTSVPGVAQRTGATLYYLEFFPRAHATQAGGEPVMALMPVPGDVDCVVASELVEAGRAMQRGLIDPDRTAVIASSHRAYAISEKSALDDGGADPMELARLLREQAKRLVLFDMDAMATKHASVISSVLLGAICGSGVLPFRKQTFEAIIRDSGIAVATNLAAFEDACERAAEGQIRPPTHDPVELEPVPERAGSPRLQPLVERLRRLPKPAQGLALSGVRRTVDYQDLRYADLYLRRLEHIAAIESQHRDDARAAGTGPWALSQAVARSLALWMTFEDTIRVADLKIRARRFARVREEIRAAPEQIVGITDFVKPRVEEIAGTLPAAMGRWVLHSPRVARGLARWTGGRRIRTHTVGGYLLFQCVAGLRRWRRGTLRYRQENERIETWLRRIEQLAAGNLSLAVELARAQRLVKGYGETHARGWRNFVTLCGQLERLAGRPDGATILARLQAAALADEEGGALASALAELEGSATVPNPAVA